MEKFDEYEYCPHCDANLTMQKGYSNELPFWICKGCGEMLINPEVDAEDDISWICDGCGCMLNIQNGFPKISMDSEKKDWTCIECGYVNKIDSSELYISEDEYQASLHNPYKGLSDEAVLALSLYEELENINDREDIILVKNLEDEKLYVKKILKAYDVSIYKYLQNHPVKNMPRIVEVYEGSNHLVIIEEYIQGKTLSSILNGGTLNQERAIHITKSICEILSKLHSLERPMIHRDVKPSNIIVTENEEVYLLDMNVAKWYKPEEKEDTKLFGTLYYAAPEQFGYGFSGSSEKTDIYPVGMLLNVMLTGKMPKEEMAQPPFRSMIERCICLEPENRYTANEMIEALENLKE